MLYYLWLALSNYANFKGRATRKEFWFLALTMIIIQLVGVIVSGLLGLFIPVGAIGYISILIAVLVDALGLLMIIPNIALAVRRLHDIGRSGWWLIGLAGLVILAGIFMLLLPILAYLFIALVVVAEICLLVAFCWPSEAQENAYGVYVENISVAKKPLKESTLRKSALAYVIIYIILAAFFVYSFNHEKSNGVHSQHSETFTQMLADNKPK